MKSTIITLAALALFSVSGFAETYEGKMSGLCCAKCVKNATKSIKTVNGVKTVQLVKEKGGDLYNLKIETATGTAITPEAVAESIKKYSDFKLETWSEKASYAPK